jgi:hypothetical protein
MERFKDILTALSLLAFGGLLLALWNWPRPKP